MTAATPERYANDVWCLDDGFGPTRLGDQVARVALEAATPFTLGVTGKWGAGKTSVLRRAFATLGGQPIAQAVPLGAKPHEEPGDWDAWRHDRRAAPHPPLDWGAGEDAQRLHTRAEQSLCVWFSPWQHQRERNPLIPLLLEIRAQFTVWQRIRHGARKLNRRGGLAALHLLEKVIDAAASLLTKRPVRMAEGTTDMLRKDWREGEPDLDLGDGQRFHLAFEDAVDMLLSGQEDARLIVFIDDLDRCEEGAIVGLLESIKLYLSSRRCVFVLGLDDAALLDALGRHWKGRSRDANREYLEKLFQAVLPVPLPRASAVQAAADAQFAAHGVSGDVRLGELVEELIEPNPRKLKNFVNSACALWDLLRAHPSTADDALSARRFVLFHYLRTQHREVWRLLERQPWSLRVLSNVLVSGGTAGAQALPLPAGFDDADQRLMKSLFFESFAHVLKDPDPADKPHERHGHLPMAEAVELLLQRADRKRSDEHFRRRYKELVIDARIDTLPEALLRLPEPQEPQA